MDGQVQATQAWGKAELTRCRGKSDFYHRGFPFRVMAFEFILPCAIYLCSCLWTLTASKVQMTFIIQIPPAPHVQVRSVDKVRK